MATLGRMYWESDISASAELEAGLAAGLEKMGASDTRVLIASNFTARVAMLTEESAYVDERISQRLFCAIKHRQFPSSHRPETRVARRREHRPRFYGFCIAMNVLVVFACTVTLLGPASVSLYNTLS